MLFVVMYSVYFTHIIFEWMCKQIDILFSFLMANVVNVYKCYPYKHKHVGSLNNI